MGRGEEPSDRGSTATGFSRKGKALNCTKDRRLESRSYGSGFDTRTAIGRPFRHRRGNWVGILIAVLSHALVSGSATAQCIPQITRLLGTNVLGSAQRGYSVALSADGSTAIVGAPGDNSNTGAVHVFARTGVNWSQQGPKLTVTGMIGQGYLGTSVSLSADGNTALVGSYGDNCFNGSAYVFTRSSGTWTQQGGKLLPSGAVGSSRFGYSVSISADGNTALVGAFGDNGNVGAVYVFVRISGSWFQQGTKLVPSGLIGTGFAGYSVSLSGDGNVALVGAYGDNSNVGAAFVFARSGGVWFQNGPKLVPSGGVGQGQFGLSASMSADGTTAIIGAAKDNGNAGAAYVFTRSGGSWVQQGSKLVPIGASGASQFGQAVSLSQDGSSALVGAKDDSALVGASYVFGRTSGSWFQQGPKLVPVGGTGSGWFGQSVALSADGHSALVGADHDADLKGVAYVFAINPTVDFVQHPASRAISAGETAFFSVGVRSDVQVTYQWRRQGTNLSNGPTVDGSVISGANGPTLAIANATIADNGSAIDCVVSTVCGSSRSNPSGLSVSPSCVADINGDGGVDGSDMSYFIDRWEDGC